MLDGDGGQAKVQNSVFRSVGFRIPQARLFLHELFPTSHHFIISKCSGHNNSNRGMVMDCEVLLPVPTSPGRLLEEMLERLKSFSPFVVEFLTWIFEPQKPAR